MKIQWDKAKIKKVIIVVLGVLVVLFLIVKQFVWGIRYDVQETGVRFKYEPNASAHFYVYKENFFFATRDGIRLVDAKGKFLWEDIYTLKDCILIGQANNVLVSENKGKEIYVYNEKGKRFHQTFKSPVIYASINRSGYVTVITNDESGYTIHVFNKEGQESSVQSNAYGVFPVGADVSEDGRVLAIAYLDINGLQMRTGVNFLYLNRQESDEKTDGKIKSGIVKEDEMIGTIRFLADGGLLCISDKSLMILRDTGALDFKEMVEMPIKNTMDQICFDDQNSNHFAIAYGATFLNETSELANTVVVYNTKGRAIAKIPRQSKVTYMAMSLNAILVGEEKTYTAYSLSGKTLWQYNALYQINDLLFFRNIQTFLQSTDMQMDILRLMKVKENAEVSTKREEPTEGEILAEPTEGDSVAE